MHYIISPVMDGITVCSVKNNLVHKPIMLLCIFFLYDAQCHDGGRETDIGQALDDGGSQSFG